MRHTLAALVAVLTLAAAPAFAGIADSPLPPLQLGRKTLHLYSVPGVMSTEALGTYFSCTSTEATSSITIGIEVFGPVSGSPINDAASTAATIQPGRTITFGTQPALGVSAEVDLGIPMLGANASARILATSKSLICTVLLADGTQSPPVSMTSLTIVAKTTQKAAN